MNHQYWLSRITPQQAAFDYRDWCDLGGLDPYRQHQLLWKLFDLPAKAEGESAPFLFRAEQQEHLPKFYVLSQQEPTDTSGKWIVESSAYHPSLASGDRLAFKLRANPVVKRPGGVVLGEDGRPKICQTGRRSGEQKFKVIRHDVVMDAKQRMGWRDLPPEQRPALAQIIQEAGAAWILERASSYGCRIDESSLRVDGHTVHRMGRYKHGERARSGITLSTLDFEGTLEVLDPTQLAKAMYGGIGPAKAFGCGLLLLRRV